MPGSDVQQVFNRSAIVWAMARSKDSGARERTAAMSASSGVEKVSQTMSTIIGLMLGPIRPRCRGIIPMSCRILGGKLLG